MATFFLVLLALGACWAFRRHLAVLVVIVYSLVTVETKYRTTERSMRQSVERWRHGA